MRPPRLDYPGARHHVLNRGARKRPIYFGSDTRRVFEELLSDFGRFGVDVHAYALMPNHYHLLVTSRTGRLSRAMRHLGAEYTLWLNRQMGWDGPLFRGRYRNLVVETEPYWAYLPFYLHLNPIRAGRTLREVRSWTTHSHYTGEVETPSWIETSALEESFGTREAYQRTFDDHRLGRGRVPDEFDPEHLWTANFSGHVDAFEQPQRFQLDRVLAKISATTGEPIERLVHPRKGRSDNRACWLATWWMSRREGVPHGQICRFLRTSHAVVSKRIRKFEDRVGTDPTLRAWLVELD